MLAFVVLFKFTDALSGAMTAPFVIDLGFTRNEYAAIVKGDGAGGAAGRRLCGGFVARADPLAASLWMGGNIAGGWNRASCWVAWRGHDPPRSPSPSRSRNSPAR